MSISNQLALFVDVVKLGSFAKAAKLHQMDNSSLSKQIKKLEATLGVTLLNRSTRSISLTSAGQDILAQSELMLENLNQIHNIADAYQSQPKGRIRIAAPVFFGQVYIQPVVTQFLKRYPEIKLSLILDDRRANIITDHIDLAFRIGRLSDSNLIAKKIANTNFALVASKQFIAKHGTPQTPEQLLTLPSVIYGNDDIHLDHLQIASSPGSKQWLNLKMRGNYVINDVQSMIKGVQEGLGYALIDLFNLQYPIHEMGLTPILTDYALSTRDTGIYAIYPHRQHTPLIGEFIQAAQQHIGTPPYWESHIPNYQQMYRP